MTKALQDLIEIGSNPNPGGNTVSATGGIWLGLANDDFDTFGYNVFVNAVGTGGTRGNVSLAAGGSNGVFYTPGTAFLYLSAGHSAVDTFTYTVTNGHGLSVTLTDTVIVTGVNQPPVAHAETATTKANQAVAMNVLANDTDLNTDAVLSVSALNAAQTKGSVSLGAGGIVTYTPGTAFQYLAVGSTATDTFGYSVADNHGDPASSTIDTVTITGTWQRPIAAAEVAATNANQSAVIAVLAGDSDPQAGQTLSLTALGTTGTKGSAVLNANGTVTYTPGASALAMAAGATAIDTFGYTVSDSHGIASSGIVAVTVTGVNTPPVASPDSVTLSATSSNTWIGSANNDTDVQGYALCVVSVNTTGTRGTVTLNPAAPKGVVYSPGSAFLSLSAGHSAIDTFSYTVSNGHGQTATATDTVIVTGVNIAPVVAKAALATTANKAVQANLLANASDPNSDAVLSVSGLALGGTKGTVTLGAGGVATYTPGSAFAYLANGAKATDSFGYTVADNHGDATAGVETVTVTGSWLAPVAKGDSATTAANQPVTINVLANDTDPQSGVTLGVSGLNLAGTNGKAAINADGTITYTPGAAFAGLAPGSATSDSFSYTLSDGHGYTATASVAVTVTAPGASANAPRALYVATNGNNAWAGDLAAPNAAGTDGPLATLRAAQLKMEASPAVKTTYIEGGDYYLSSTLSLGAADSGESWLAMPGQTPVIHGGQAVTGWVQGANGIWTAPAPAGSINNAGAGNTDLFVNGVREEAARYPNASPTNPVQGGWVAAAASLPGENTRTSFQFTAGSIPVFASTAGLYVSIYEQNGWQNDSLPVSSINYSTGTITLAGSAGGSLGAGSRFFIYDAASQLNAPGEWYANTATNTISLDAPAGFNGTGVSTGSLPSIFGVYGATNVTIAGLTLAGTSPTGNGIRADGAAGLVVAGNTITDAGNAIQLSGAASGTDIQSNVIENTDNYGVLIDPGANNITIQGNTIRDIGQLLDGNGIWFNGSSNDTITNNLVQDTAGSGIGGTSTASAHSVNDVISYNQVANANQASSDGGGIYIGNPTLNKTGDVISYNEITGTTAVQTAASPSLSFFPTSKLVGFGIYLDDYANGVTVTGNVLDNNLNGIDIHSGSNNVVSDNSIANTTTNALQFQLFNPLNLTPTASGNVFEGNLISNTSPTQYLVANLGDPANATFTGNFYDAAGLSSTAFVSDTSGTWKSASLAGWQAQGYDQGAIGAGPAVSAASFTGAPMSQVGLAGFVPTTPYFAS